MKQNREDPRTHSYHATFVMKVHHSSSQFLNRSCSVSWVNTQLYRTYIPSWIYFCWKTCRMYFKRSRLHLLVETSSRSPLLTLKPFQWMCHNYVLSWVCNLKKEKVFCVYTKKIMCALLEGLCVYLNSHCNFFLWEYRCYVSIHATGRPDIWLFLVLHVSW